MATTDDKLRLIIETQDKFSKDLKKYDSQVNKIAKSSTTATSKTKGLSSGMGTLGKALPTLALGLAAKKMFSYISATNEAIDKTYNLSKQTGIAVETLSSLDYVFQLNKASSADVAGTFNYMSRTIGALEAGGETAINKFEKFGISIKDVDGNMRSMEEIFFDSIDTLNQIENKTERSAKATQLFGRSAGNLASVIDTGSEALRNQAKEAVNLGIAFDEEAAKKAEKFNDTLLKLESSASGFARELTTVLSPALTNVFETLQSIFNSPEEKTFTITYKDKDGNTQTASRALTTGDQGLIRTTGQTDMSMVGGNSPLQDDLQLAKQMNLSLQELRAYRIAINKSEKESLAVSKKKTALNEASARALKAQRDVNNSPAAKAVSEKADEGKTIQWDSEARVSAREELARTQMQETADIERELMKEAELYRLTGSDRELKRLEQEFASKRDLYIDYNGDIIALNEEFERKKTEITESEAERQRAITEANYAKEAQIFDMKLSQAEAYTKGISSLAMLAVDGDKDAAKKKKRIATGEAIIYGGLTQAKVWSEWGWPAGLPWSIAALGTTAANIATIQSANFTNGGLIAGTSQYGDKTNINVNADERILTRSDQSYLTDVLKARSANGNGNNQTVIHISGNYGVNENALARMVVNGTNQANKTNQPNRILA